MELDNPWDMINLDPFFGSDRNAGWKALNDKLGVSILANCHPYWLQKYSRLSDAYSATLGLDPQAVCVVESQLMQALQLNNTRLIEMLLTKYIDTQHYTFIDNPNKLSILLAKLLKSSQTNDVDDTAKQCHEMVRSKLGLNTIDDLEQFVEQVNRLTMVSGPALGRLQWYANLSDKISRLGLADVNLIPEMLRQFKNFSIVHASK